MAPRGGKNRQATVEPEDSESGEQYDGVGETGGEIVPATGSAGHNINTPPAQVTMIPGFSQEQVSGFMTMIAAVVDARLEQRLGNYSTNRQENSPFPSIQNLSLQPLQPPQNQPPPNQPSEQDPRSQSFPEATGTKSSHLRAEEVGYFDPEYQQEHGSSNGPVVNAGKHVFYKDVYIFTNRLQDLAVQRGEADTKAVLSSCLRGSALMWYSMELTELERDLLRDANLDQWYTTLIKRFKTRTAVALSQLVGQTYSLNDIRHTSPRAFIQHMLHLAKSAEFYSTHNQLTLLWNQFAVNLRRDLPEPQATTTIGEFLDQVDSKTAIWLEMAQKSQQQRQWNSQPAPQDPTGNSSGNDQKGGSAQQYSGSRRFQRRIPIKDGKSHAYLADVSPEGYAIYEEEDEADEHDNG